MNQQVVDPIVLCFNPACPDPYNLRGEDTCCGCGAPLRLQGRYSALRVLGRGGFGRTLLAIDELQTPVVACAIAQRWHGASTSGKLARSPGFNPWESQQLADLGSHPHLPTLVEMFERDGSVYLVQEYIPGTNLAIALAKRGTFTPPEIWTILDSLLPVLHFLHQRQAIHRDIKPENILMRGHQVAAGELVLVDFGAIQWLTPAASIHPTPATGNPEYAAPEQMRGQAMAASDLYSLGVTCLHLLTGIRPVQLFDMVDYRWAWRACWSPEETRNHRDLAAMLDRLVAPVLNQRFASAEAAIAYLQTVRFTTNFTTNFTAKGTVNPRKPAVTAPPPKPPWQCYATLTDRNGLFASINAVAIAADGAVLASASDDKTVRLWQVQTGDKLAVLRGHEKPVKAVAFHSRIATLLASGGRDRTIQLWDVADCLYATATNEHQPMRTLTGHQHQVNALAFSPDGATLASGSADKTVILWHVETGERVATLAKHALAVNAVAFSPQSSLLVSASTDATAIAWDSDRLEPICCLTKHTAGIAAIAFSPDGTLLATGGEDRTIHLWDTSSWKPIRTLSGHPWLVSALSFSPDGTLLFSGSWDKTVKAWNVATGEECAVLSGHRDSVTCMTIAPDGNVLASGSADKTVKLWRYSSE